MKDGGAWCFYSYKLLEEIALESGPLELFMFENYFEEATDLNYKESIYNCLKVLDFENLKPSEELEKRIEMPDGSIFRYSMSIGMNQVSFKIDSDEVIEVDNEPYVKEYTIQNYFELIDGKLVFVEIMAAG